MDSGSHRTVFASVMAGVSAASLLFGAVHLMTRNRQGSHPFPSDTHTCPRSCDDVARWLSTANVPQRVVRVLHQHDVDGEALLALSVQDLVEMGLSPHDRATVLTAVAKLDDVPQGGQSRAGPRQAPHRRLQLQHVSGEAPAVQLHSFLLNAEGLFSDLVSPSSPLTADGDMDFPQQRLQMASRLYDLLDLFHGLSSADQEGAMLPLARRLNVVLTRPTPRPTPRSSVTRPQEAASLPSPSPRHAAAAADESIAARDGVPADDLAGKLQPLHEMVDSFLVMLQSSDLDGVPADSLLPIANRIMGQIDRVSNVAAHLPPSVGGDLQRKCDGVRQLLVQRLRGDAAAAAPTAPTAAGARAPPRDAEAAGASAPQPVSVASLMGRLRDVFQRARDGSMLQMQPRQRLVVVDELVAEVTSILEALDAMPASNQSDAARGAAENVLSVLSQLRSLSEEGAALEDAPTDEMEGEVPGADRGESAQQPKAPGSTRAAEAGGEVGDDSSSAEFGAVTATFIQQIAEILQSAQYSSATPAEKLTIIGRLSARVDSFGAAAQNLSPPHRQPAIAVIQSAKELLARAAAAAAAPGQQAKRGAPKEAAKHEAAQPEGDGEGDDGEEAEGEEAATGGDAAVASGSDALDGAVTQLEHIFNLLNSERFDSASPQEKQLVATELLRRVQTLKQPILSALGGDAEHPIVTELVGPLEDLLETMSQGGGPSAELRDIVETLAEMEEVLSSEALARAPRHQQDAIAKSIIGQLQRITSTFDSLSPSERVAAEKMVAPLNKRLLELVRGNAAAGRDGEEEEEGEETTPAEARGTPNPRELMARLQRVMALLQSDEFGSAAPPEQAAMLDDGVEALAEIQDDCQRLPAEIRGTLLPIVERLMSQMSGLRSAFGDAAGASEEGESGGAPDAAGEVSQQDERRNMFASIADITQELKRGNESRITLTTEETAPLRQLLVMVESVGNLTAAEKKLRDGFATQLERAERGAATKDAAAAEADDGENTSDDDDGRDDRLEGDDVDDGDASGGSGDDGPADEEGVRHLIDLFSSLESTLDEGQPSSLQQLMPIMAAVERTLAAAEQSGIHWQRNAEAITVVSRTLNKVQAAQRKLQEQGSAASAAVAAITAAKERLEQNPPTSRAELTPYLELLKEAMTSPTFTAPEMAAMEALKDAIIAAGGRLQRQNEAAKEPAAEGNTANSPERVGHQTSAGAFDENDTDTSSVTADAGAGLVSLDEVSSTEVIGGAECEVKLLDRIEKRVSLPTEDFIAACSLFDIQAISKVLLHLSSGNVTVSGDASLRNRVDAVKAKFINQLSAFRAAGSTSGSAEPSEVLRITGRDVAGGDADGNASHELTIFTADEEDQYPINDAFIAHIGEARNVMSPTVTRNVADKWPGRSMAFIVCSVEGLAAAQEGKDTTLSELVLLHEVLAHRYDFDVVTITDPKLNAESLLRIIKDAQAACEGRLFVYYCTPPEENDVSVPHSMVFQDGSVLPHSKILDETRGAVERVVVVHSQSKAFEMACRLKEKISPLMTVRLTSKAAAAVAQIRCWLYTGIFTPVVAELLCRDDGRMLCPEDLINYVITATTRMKIEFGSFTESEPAGMAYFLPNDISTITFDTA